MKSSPDWTVSLGDAGNDAVHWSGVGAVDAPDDRILGWAWIEDRAVLTSDLDIDALLATSGDGKPSVIQLRTVSTLSSRIGPLVMRVRRNTEADLTSGALVTVDDHRVRLRPLTFTAKL